MGFLVQFVVFMLFPWFLSVRAEENYSSQHCDFPAIFNFGDSNSDTGCMAAAFYPEVLPYGETFFHEPVGRASDGRLIIDFIGIYLFNNSHHFFALFLIHLFVKHDQMTCLLFLSTLFSFSLIIMWCLTTQVKSSFL